MKLQITNQYASTFATIDTDTDLPYENLYFVLPDGRDFSLFFYGDEVSLGAYREEDEQWMEAEGGVLDVSTLPPNPHTAWEA